MAAWGGVATGWIATHGRERTGGRSAACDASPMRALILVVSLLAVSACAPRRFAPDDRDAIAALLAAQAGAWNHGDLEGFMAAYAHDDALVFTSGGEIHRGWQTTHDRYLERYRAADARSEMGTLAFEVIEIRELGVDGAIALGTWTLTQTPKAGTGVFTLALSRTADGWRIVHDHTSVRAAK